MTTPFRDLLGMERVQCYKTNRSPIREPEVVRRDVKHVWNLFKLAKFRGHCIVVTVLTKCDFPTITISVLKWLRQQPTTGNSNMTAQTGSTYTSGTTVDSVECHSHKYADVQKKREYYCHSISVYRVYFIIRYLQCRQSYKYIPFGRHIATSGC